MNEQIIICRLSLEEITFCRPKTASSKIDLEIISLKQLQWYPHITDAKLHMID